MHLKTVMVRGPLVKKRPGSNLGVITEDTLWEGKTGNFTGLQLVASLDDTSS